MGKKNKKQVDIRGFYKKSGQCTSGAAPAAVPPPAAAAVPPPLHDVDDERVDNPAAGDGAPSAAARVEAAAPPPPAAVDARANSSASSDGAPSAAARVEAAAPPPPAAVDASPCSIIVLFVDKTSNTTFNIEAKPSDLMTTLIFRYLLKQASYVMSSDLKFFCNVVGGLTDVSDCQLSIFDFISGCGDFGNVIYVENSSLDRLKAESDSAMLNNNLKRPSLDEESNANLIDTDENGDDKMDVDVEDDGDVAEDETEDLAVDRIGENASADATSGAAPAAVPPPAAAVVAPPHDVNDERADNPAAGDGAPSAAARVEAAAPPPPAAVDESAALVLLAADDAPVHALALVRIQCNTAPSRIVTSQAVAAARSQPHDAAGGKSDHPRVLRAGCVMGRSGAAGSRPRPDCIDLGIPNDSVGISRRHVEVVRVCNLDPPSGPRRRPPYARIRVLPGAMNGVQHHYTRRIGDGVRRMSDALSCCYLEPGEERRLRLGDIIEFFTAPSHLFYCVVGLGGSAPASLAPSPAAGEDLSSRLAEAEHTDDTRAGSPADGDDAPSAAARDEAAPPVVQLRAADDASNSSPFPLRLHSCAAEEGDASSVSSSSSSSDEDDMWTMPVPGLKHGDVVGAEVNDNDGDDKSDVEVDVEDNGVVAEDEAEDETEDSAVDGIGENASAAELYDKTEPKKKETIDGGRNEGQEDDSESSDDEDDFLLPMKKKKNSRRTIHDESSDEESIAVTKFDVDMSDDACYEDPRKVSNDKLVLDGKKKTIAKQQQPQMKSAAPTRRVEESKKTPAARMLKTSLQNYFGKAEGGDREVKGEASKLVKPNSNTSSVAREEWAQLLQRKIEQSSGKKRKIGPVESDSHGAKKKRKTSKGDRVNEAAPASSGSIVYATDRNGRLARSRTMGKTNPKATCLVDGCNKKSSFHVNGAPCAGHMAKHGRKRCQLVYAPGQSHDDPDALPIRLVSGCGRMSHHTEAVCSKALAFYYSNDPDAETAVSEGIKEKRKNTAAAHKKYDDKRDEAGLGRNDALTEWKTKGKKFEHSRPIPDSISYYCCCSTDCTKHSCYQLPTTMNTLCALYGSSDNIVVDEVGDHLAITFTCAHPFAGARVDEWQTIVIRKNPTNQCGLDLHQLNNGYFKLLSSKYLFKSQDEYNDQEERYKARVRNSTVGHQRAAQRNQERVMRTSTQVVPSTELLLERESSVVNALVNSVNNSNTTVVNVSKGRLTKLHQGRIDAVLNGAREKEFAKNADFEEQLRSGDLVGALEYAGRNGYKRASRLLEDLKDSQLRLEKNEGFLHLTDSPRNPPFLVHEPSSGRSSELVRSISAEELKSSGALTSVYISGLGCEQMALSAELHCQRKLKDSGTESYLFSNVGGGKRIGTIPGFYAIQSYALDVRRLKEYYKRKNWKLVLNEERSPAYKDRIQSALEDLELEIMKPTADTYRKKKAALEKVMAMDAYF